MAKTKHTHAPIEKSLLLRKRNFTVNVPPFDREVIIDGGKALAPATPELRVLAQNLIDTIHELRHLKKAKIVLLVEANDATRKKLEKGERVTIGKAAKCNLVHRIMTAKPATIEEQQTPRSNEVKEIEGELPGFDFFIKLSADWLEKVGFHTGDEACVLKASALIHHELMHCGAKIAGQYVAPTELRTFVENLGSDHVETCNDIANKKGHVLVRYLFNDAGHYTWTLRKHDLEEFHGVVEQHGPWQRDVSTLVDIIIESKDTPLFRVAG